MPQPSRPLSFSKDALSKRIHDRQLKEERAYRCDGLWKIALIYVAVLVAGRVTPAILSAAGLPVRAEWTWATVPGLAAGIAVGWALSLWKRKSLASYAVAEVFFGSVSILVGLGKLWHAVGAHDQAAAWSGAIALVGGLYVVSRGFGNRKDAFDRRWGAARVQARCDWLDAAKTSAAAGDIGEAFENMMKAVEVAEN